MRVIKVYPRGYGSNSYVLTADGKTAVVIDPAEESIADELDKNGLECKYVLLTHGHFDHVGGCGVLYQKGAHICCGEREKDLIFSKEYLGIFGGVYVPHFEISRTFSDGESFSFCGICFKVMFTAGHTEGSVCYIAGENIFTGDTLFENGVGRWDLPTGNFKKLSESLIKISGLKNGTVYCGHGGDTTLERERKHNPYLRNIKC